MPAFLFFEFLKQVNIANGLSPLVDFWSYYKKAKN